MKKVTFLAVIPAVLVAADFGHCGETPFFDRLVDGPYQVGHTVRHVTDYSRSFEPAFDAAADRQDGTIWRRLPISIWYPARNAAERQRISYAHYLTLTETDSNGPAPSETSALRALDLIRARYVPKWTEVNTETLTDILRGELNVYFNADPASGTFPLILGAPGAWNPACDNSALYEYLASHGYVVAAGPSLGFTTERMSLDQAGLEAQTRDLEFIASSMRGFPGVDISQIGIAGFSWGGLAAVMCAQRSQFVDAVVSLDGSVTLSHRVALLESCPFLDPATYTTPTAFVLAHDDDPDRHDLMFYHNMKYADASVVRLSHNTHEYCTAYGISVFLRPGDNVGNEDLQLTKTGYETFCRFILDFFDYYLKHRESGIADKDTYEFLDPDACHWVDSKQGRWMPPMHEKFFTLLSARGVAEARQVFDKARELDPTAVLFSADEMNQYGFRAIEDGAVSDAIQILSMSCEAYPDSFDAHYFMSYAYFTSDQKDSARAYLERALRIDPEHAEAGEKLKLLSR